VETIQDIVEKWLMSEKYYKTAKAYILYRENHKNIRFIKERIDYIQNYVNSGDNAASSSETDDNANVLLKNVANLNGEVYKNINRQIQRRRIKQKLSEMYSNKLSNQYLQDLEDHIIYTHDESSFPVVMPYCSAYSLYPLISEGVGNIDGVTPKPPKNLDSFCGQFVNLVFLLASQVKGAVAFGEFFNFLDYFCVKDFGENYHRDTLEVVSLRPKRTISEAIHQAYQQIVYGWNQPAGNRSYQSPFTNISYYDENYWHALFDDFNFPDGTQPKWERVNWLQKDFMQWFNQERTKTLLTFPVNSAA
jgi:ribonucleoside-triphosphate reductase